MEHNKQSFYERGHTLKKTAKYVIYNLIKLETLTDAFHSFLIQPQGK